MLLRILEDDLRRGYEVGKIKRKTYDHSAGGDLKRGNSGRSFEYP